MKRNPDARCGNCEYSVKYKKSSVVDCIKYPHIVRKDAMDICGCHPDFLEKEPEHKGDPARAMLDSWNRVWNQEPRP